MFLVFVILSLVLIISILLLLVEGFIAGFVDNINYDNPDAGFLDNR
jgi:hypothetical protein